MRLSKTQTICLIGDTIVLAIVTVAGFARHNTLDSAGARLLTTFLPMLAAWLLVAPFLGAFDPANIEAAGQLWRPFWGMILAAPLGALLRGLWLGRPIEPVFVIVLGGVSALALLAWRAVVVLYAARGAEAKHG